MRLERGFRISFYLSMALATACLGYVNLATYPAEIALLAALVGGLLLIAYTMEGRWALSRSAATRLDVVIAAGSGVYFGAFFFTVPATERQDVTAVVLLLPRMGLILVVLMLAYVFRAKRVGDFRKLHLLAFMMVALACSLDSDFPLAFLLLSYLVCVLWSLACFYLYAEQIAAASAAGGTAPVSPAVVPWRLAGLGQAARRLAGLSLVAVVFYVLTPRHLASSWEDSLFRSLHMQTGLGDALMDLNRTGTIRTDKSVAFEVEVRSAAGQPKHDLDPGQRWRSRTLVRYEGGRWTQRHDQPKARPVQPGGGEPVGDAQLPDLGPQQYFLTYYFPLEIKSLPVLAEPIVFPPEPGSPVIFFIKGRGAISGQRLPGNGLRAPLLFFTEFCTSYRQVTVPAEVPGLSPPVEIDERTEGHYRELPSMPQLKLWTDRLLTKLVEQDRLTAADVQRLPNGELPPRVHERVARALEVHLAGSGEYTYSLQLLRHDRHVDPVVDFLCNVKEGHCERFASGLAVMLRLQGIPARIVVGLRGAETMGEGRYLVRQSHAHSWVEALVQRRDAEGELRSHWLTLDPTPGEGQGDAVLSGWDRWWRDLRLGGGSFWRSYVVEYDASQQDALFTGLSSRTAWRQRLQTVAAWTEAVGLPGQALVVGTVLLLGGLLIRRRWRRRHTAARSRPEAAFYERLLRLVARRCRLKPEPAQTAQEFARLVAERLEHGSHTRPVAHVPGALAALYYRVRYAQQPLTDVEGRAVDEQLGQLEAALKRKGPVVATVANGARAE